MFVDSALERIDAQQGFVEDPGAPQESWATGRMRTVPLPDLLIAAVAEQHGVTVMQYDADDDRVAAVTGQSMQSVVPRGAVP